MNEGEIPGIAKFWEDEHNIMHVVLLHRLELSEEDAKKYVATAMRVSGGKPKLVLTDFREVDFMMMGAFNRFAGPEMSKITKAAALLVNMSSPFTALGASLLLKLERDPFPMKVFTDEKEAIDWLLSLEKK